MVARRVNHCSSLSLFSVYLARSFILWGIPKSILPVRMLTFYAGLYIKYLPITFNSVCIVPALLTQNASNSILKALSIYKLIYHVFMPRMFKYIRQIRRQFCSSSRTASIVWKIYLYVYISRIRTAKLRRIYCDSGSCVISNSPNSFKSFSVRHWQWQRPFISLIEKRTSFINSVLIHLCKLPHSIYVDFLKEVTPFKMSL